MFAYVGHKSAVHSHLNYLVIVSPPIFASASHASATVRNFAARTSTNTDITKLTVFDVENKFIAYSGTFTEGVRDVFCEWGQIFVLSNDGKVILQYLNAVFVKLTRTYSCPVCKRSPLPPSWTYCFRNHYMF